MKRLILTLILGVMAIPGIASACMITKTADLSDAQIQQLVVSCEQMKLEAQKTAKAATEAIVPAVTKENITEWAQISQEFAKALGIAAREVGVSVNEFLKSPAGILTAIVLIWMTIGGSLMAVTVGLLFTYIIYKANQRIWFRDIETVQAKGLFGSTKTKGIHRYNTWGDMNDCALGVSIVSVAALGVFWAILVAHI